MNFVPYTGDLMGLPTDENHLNFRWDNESCKILFSVCRQGNGASCHFASDKKGLRKLGIAINEFINFVFSEFKWCEVIFAKIIPRSVKKISEKLGFTFLGTLDEKAKRDVYILTKEKYYE
jgi:hypothetical protein